MKTVSPSPETFRLSSSLELLETTGLSVDRDQVTNPLPEHQARGLYLETLAVWPRQFERAQSIRYCCSDANVYVRDAEYQVWPRRCRDRLCPRCQAALRVRYAAEIAVRMADWQSPKHIVLTLRSSDQPLREQLTRLKRCFSRLRRTSTWRALCGAGVYTFEVTRSPNTRRFHPHLHILVNARFIPHRWLSSEWHRITGDSPIVHVSTATARHPRYLAKYVGKGVTASLEPWEEWPMADELAGLRALETFGGCARIRVRVAPDPDGGWCFVGRFRELRRRAEAGEWFASLVLDELTKTGALENLRLCDVESDW